MGKKYPAKESAVFHRCLESVSGRQRLLFFVICGILLGALSGCVPLTYKTAPPRQSASQDFQKKQQLQISQANQVALSNFRDYRVGPEDLLVLDVYAMEGQKHEPLQRRVNGLGEISVPLVGVVQVGGLTTKQIEARLKELYGSQFLRNPQVSVEVKEYSHQRVAVTGAVEKPGFFEIIGPRTLLEVLSLAGGFSNKPRAEAGDVIHVIRHQSAADVAKAIKLSEGRMSFSPKTLTTVIDTKRLVSGEAPELNMLVESGDVVHVPYAGNAYVLGGVKKPGNVTVKENLTLSQAIAVAGGVDPLLGVSKVIIMRFDKQGRPLRIETDLKKIQSGQEADLPVLDNDAIVVQESETKKKLWVIRQILPVPSGGYAIPTQ